MFTLRSRFISLEDADASPMDTISVSTAQQNLCQIFPAFTSVNNIEIQWLQRPHLHATGFNRPGIRGGSSLEEQSGSTKARGMPELWRSLEEMGAILERAAMGYGSGGL